MKRELWIAVVTLAVPLWSGCGPDAGTSAFARTLDGGGPAIEAEAEAGDTVPVARRLWTLDEPDFYASTPSPDGRYVTEIDWWTGDLAVFDLIEGKLNRITDKGSWADSVAWAESSVFSPDGRRIAYTWWNQDNDGYEVRIRGVDGSNEWAVLPHPAHAHVGEDAAERELGYVMVEDWSSDGESLLAVLWYGDLRGDTWRSTWVELATISTGDGSLRTLKRTDWRGPEMAVFAPDDRHVAFDFPPDPDSDDRDLFSLDLATGAESTLFAGPGDDRLMGWVPDGSGILFHSDRELTQGIWFLPVEEGRVAGEPHLLKADVWGLFPLGFSRDAYYYGIELERPQVHTAVIDFEARRFAVPPASVEDPSESWSVAPAWSPEGKYLAYVQRRTGERPGQLVIRSAAGDEKREIPLNIWPLAVHRWTADGQAILLEGREKGRRGHYRVDLTSGTAELVLGEGEVRGASFSADGRTVFSSRRVSEDHSDLIRIELDSREETVLAQRIEGGLSRPSVSPDGRTLALRVIRRPENAGSSIMVVPTDGGELAELVSLPMMGGGGLSWSPDGRYLVYRVAGMEEDAPDALWRLPVSGGVPEQVLTSPLQLRGTLQIHPDGRRVAFESGEWRGEIWVLENLPGTSPRLQAGRAES